MLKKMFSSLCWGGSALRSPSPYGYCFSRSVPVFSRRSFSSEANDEGSELSPNQMRQIFYRMRNMDKIKEYTEEYNDLNREKINQKNLQYYERMRGDPGFSASQKRSREFRQEKLKAYSKEYYEKNRVSIQAKNRSYYERNKERILERAKERYQETKNPSPSLNPSEQLQFPPGEVVEWLSEAHGDDVELVAGKHAPIPDIDFMVIATARSSRHLAQLGEGILAEVRKRSPSLRPHLEGANVNEGSGWVVVDAGNFIVHIMIEEARAVYGEALKQKDPGEME